MCDCIETVNAKLAQHNTRLREPMLLMSRGAGDQDQARRLFIETEQIETGRGKPKAMAMFTSRCPFCGEEYAAKEAMEPG